MEDKKKKSHVYTLGEEIFNSVSHGVGTLLAIAGLVIMIVFSALYGDGFALASSIIYGITMTMLYLMSTLYHALTPPRAKSVFRVLDHCSIFLLIAGSYTPYCLITLKGTIGIPLFCVIWGVSVLGIILNSISLEKFKTISLISYLAMGWAIIFAIKPLVAALPTMGMILLAVGGAMYSGGVVFYVMKKYRYMHSIWHLFVLAGTIFQYFSILLYVIPSTFIK